MTHPLSTGRRKNGEKKRRWKWRERVTLALHSLHLFTPPQRKREAQSRLMAPPPPSSRRSRHAAAAAAAAAADAAPSARPAAEVSALAAIAAGLLPDTRLTREELARFRGRVGEYAAVR